jgi:hypothetical protein
LPFRAQDLLTAHCHQLTVSMTGWDVTGAPVRRYAADMPLKAPPLIATST